MGGRVPPMAWVGQWDQAGVGGDTVATRGCAAKGSVAGGAPAPAPWRAGGTAASGSVAGGASAVAGRGHGGVGLGRGRRQRRGGRGHGGVGLGRGRRAGASGAAGWGHGGVARRRAPPAQGQRHSTVIVFNSPAFTSASRRSWRGAYGSLVSSWSRTLT